MINQWEPLSFSEVTLFVRKRKTCLIVVWGDVSFHRRVIPCVLYSRLRNLHFHESHTFYPMMRGLYTLIGWRNVQHVPQAIVLDVFDLYSRTFYRRNVKNSPEALSTFLHTIWKKWKLDCVKCYCIKKPMKACFVCAYIIIGEVRLTKMKWNRQKWPNSHS